MKLKKDLMIAILCTFCLTVALFSLIPRSNSPAVGQYDPWLDYDDNGRIDMNDIYYSAKAFGQFGDPTKPVNVTNWPENSNVTVTDLPKDSNVTVSNWPKSLNVNVTSWPKGSDVSVWYGYSLINGASVLSGFHHPDGYSRLHILISIGDITSGETVEFILFAALWNAAHSTYDTVRPYTYTFTSTVYSSAVSIDVPSETFFFWFDAASGTTCTVSLSYYLTWA